MATLEELLALLPDNETGQISAADMRTIVTELYNQSAEPEPEMGLMALHVGPNMDLVTEGDYSEEDPYLRVRYSGAVRFKMANQVMLDGFRYGPMVVLYLQGFFSNAGEEFGMAAFGLGTPITPFPATTMTTGGQMIWANVIPWTGLSAGASQDMSEGALTLVYATNDPWPAGVPDDGSGYTFPIGDQ